MAQIMTINKRDELFPEYLREIGEDCPKRIFVMGNIDLLQSERKVAIIGSRKATRAGICKAYDLGLEYARKGCVVVSGLAFGCDAAAHRGAWLVELEQSPLLQRVLTWSIHARIFRFKKKFSETVA